MTPPSEAQEKWATQRELADALLDAVSEAIGSEALPANIHRRLADAYNRIVDAANRRPRRHPRGDDVSEPISDTDDRETWIWPCSATRLREALTSWYAADGESWRLVAMDRDGGIVAAGIPEALLDAIIRRATREETT